MTTRRDGTRALLPPPTRAARRGGAAGLAAVMALGTIPAMTALGTAANAAVTVGSNISAFPDRDMVVAVGYEVGQELLVEVLRGDVVIGSARGPAVTTPEGVGLEVNHGAEGTPAPGDCWDGYTPDIIGGDLIRVTPAGSTVSDTMTVADLSFSGPPVREGDDAVSVSGTATPGLVFGVEFRRDKPDPRFRDSTRAPVFEADGNVWKATYRMTPGTEGLTVDEQRDILLNEASWLAVAGGEGTETTLAELGETAGVAAGCTGSDDPNTLVGGLDPINVDSLAATSPDRTFSGTARADVAAVSVTVGDLGARDATLTPSTDPTAPSTWTLTVPKADLETLPDGNVTVTPSFDGTAGAPRTVLKDTVEPLAPTATPEPGTYSTTQNVALVKPSGETRSKLYWEIGPSASTTPDPDEFSNPYTGQIAISSSQTVKARLIDAAGNAGALGTFAYTIGPADTTPPPADPSNPPPTVAPLAPADGATGASRTYNITMRMSEAVEGVSETTVTLTNTVTGALVGSTVTYKPSTLGVVLDPSATLAAGTKYTVTATGGSTAIRDLAGAPLVTRSWSFTTEGTATTPTDPPPPTGGTNTAPTLTMRSPGPGATGVSRINNITMRFSEAVQGVDETTVTLRNTSTGARITSAVTYKSDTLGVILNPGTTLAANTRYTVDVDGGTDAIRDLAGAPFVDTSWTFTTGS